MAWSNIEKGWRRWNEQAGRRGEDKKLSQNRESLVEKLFLSLIKTVFAKFDNRLG